MYNREIKYHQWQSKVTKENNRRVAETKGNKRNRTPPVVSSLMIAFRHLFLSFFLSSDCYLMSSFVIGQYNHCIYGNWYWRRNMSKIWYRQEKEAPKDDRDDLYLSIYLALSIYNAIVRYRDRHINESCAPLQPKLVIHHSKLWWIAACYMNWSISPLVRRGRRGFFVGKTTKKKRKKTEKGKRWFRWRIDRRYGYEMMNVTGIISGIIYIYMELGIEFISTKFWYLLLSVYIKYHALIHWFYWQEH